MVSTQRRTRSSVEMQSNTGGRAESIVRPLNATSDCLAKAARITKTAAQRLPLAAEPPPNSRYLVKAVISSVYFSLMPFVLLPHAAAEPQAALDPHAAVEPHAAVAPQGAVEPQAADEPQAAAEPHAAVLPHAAAEPQAAVLPHAADSGSRFVLPQTFGKLQTLLSQRVPFAFVNSPCPARVL